MSHRIWFLALGAVLLFGQGASAHTYVFTTTLSGDQENPVNDSDGVGFSTVTIDSDLFTMRVQAEFSDLTGTTTAAHIHCCQIPPTNAIVASISPSFTSFPLGVTAGVYDFTYDMTVASSYNAAFITASGGTVSGSFQRLLNSLLDDNSGQRAYLNLHTTYRSGGEIRGFYSGSEVPEPVSASLVLLGLGALALRRRARVV